MLMKAGKTELIYEKEMARISTVLADNGIVVFSIADIDKYGTTTKWTRPHYIFEIDG